jgi:hypothetical protein
MKRFPASRPTSLLLLSAVLLGFCAELSSGCTQVDDSTQITVALTSEAEAFTELGCVQLTVRHDDGSIAFQYPYTPDNAGFFPATVGIKPQDSSSLDRPIHVDVQGFAGNCATGAQAAAPVVERTAVVSYIDGRNLLLPMPLRMACFDQSCAAGSTCVGGLCQAIATTPASSLPDYSSDLVTSDDGGNGCFDEQTCLAGAVPVTVNADCTFALPAGSASVNVAVQWAAAEGRIIVLEGDDPQEGWSMTDAGAGMLSTGVCTAVQESADGGALPVPDKAVSVWVTTACPTVHALQPFCRRTAAEPVGIGRTLDVDAGSDASARDAAANDAGP